MKNILLLLTDQKDSINSGSFSEPMEWWFILILLSVPFIFLILFKIAEKLGILKFK